MGGGSPGVTGASSEPGLSSPASPGQGSPSRTEGGSSRSLESIPRWPWGQQRVAGGHAPSCGPVSGLGCPTPPGMAGFHPSQVGSLSVFTLAFFSVKTDGFC